MNVLAHASYTQQRAWSKYSARAAQWSLLARTPEHLQIESIAKYRFFHRAIFHPNFDVRIAMFPPNMCQNTNKKHFYEENGVNSAQCCGGAVERYDEHHRSIRTAHWNILCADECVCDVQLRGASRSHPMMERFLGRLHTFSNVPDSSKKRSCRLSPCLSYNFFSLAKKKTFFAPFNTPTDVAEDYSMRIPFLSYVAAGPSDCRHPLTVRYAELN